MPVLNHWPSGMRDTTQFPNADFQVSVAMREHLKAFIQMDGVGWNDHVTQRMEGELDVADSRLRTYRKMYEKLGLIYKDDETLRLSRLGKQISSLENDLNGLKKGVLKNLSATAIDILSRYQLRNPAEEAELPATCDVLPCICIWKTMLALDGKLHQEEMNRVLLWVMKMSDLDAAIERLRAARARFPSYAGHDAAALDAELGPRVHTDQPDARIAPWFSFAGWGGLIIETQVAVDGFRHLTEEPAPIIERIIANPPTYYNAADVDDWFTYYIGTAAEHNDDFEVLEYIPVAMKPKQVIFFGAPGTGKSYEINEIIKAFYPDPDIRSAHCLRVTFYPDYEYSDFVGALRPVRHPAKGLDYEFIPGPMTRILAECFKHPSEVFFLVIEEINRGNAPAIFGDLFQLLDRGSSGKSVYETSNVEVADCLRKETNYPNTFVEKKIWFPPNLSILCSMNTADQNVFTLDTAFSRRFERVYIPINFNRFSSLPPGAKKDLYLGEIPIFAGSKALTEVFKDTELTTTVVDLEAKGLLLRNWPVFAILVNRLIDIINDRDGTDRISEDKKLGPFFASETDLSSREAFLNKVIYYLKQDVFRYEEQYFDVPYQTIYDQYLSGGDLFALLKPGE